MKTIKPKELPDLLSARLGLVLGPAATLRQGVLGDLSATIADEFGVSAGQNYQETAELAIAETGDELRIRDFVRSHLSAIPGSPDLQVLAQVPWKAVLTVSMDNEFENRFVEESDRRPSRKQVTVLSDLTQQTPPRTVPVFKLLGSVLRPEFAYSQAQYMIFRTRWGRAIKEFADSVRHGAALCLGLGGCAWIFQDLLAEIRAQATATPAGIFLLADDPLQADPLVRSLLGQRTSLVLVDGTLNQLVRAARDIGYSGRQIRLFAEDHEALAVFARYADVAVVVNAQVTARVSEEERNRLHDLLFSPASLYWDPYAYDMDLRRTAGKAFAEEVARGLKERATRISESEAYVLRGNVACGKTTIMKRTALEVAKSGHLALWLRSSAATASQESLIALFNQATQRPAHKGKTVVVFMDDPPSFGSLHPSDVVEAATTAKATIALVISARTGDWNAMRRERFVGPLPIAHTTDVPDTLDMEEVSDFADYLVTLCFAPDRQEGEARLQRLHGRTAQDTLSMLYWLLPQTRSAISNSIRDEYFRLGDGDRLARALFAAASEDSALLRSAYEMVAVADHYHAPLPIEVLVSALNIDYQAWLDLVAPGGAVWGLIYSDEDPDGDTVTYHARNAVITRTIVETINGGAVGHSGELRVLSNLLEACTGTRPPYREFCARVLVKNEQFDKLDYRDGLKLYDLALASLPFPDQTLQHHRGLWIKDHGRQPMQAYRALEEAAMTPVAPNVRKAEAKEHIENSMAATLLDAIDAGELDLQAGKRLALEHLQRARSQNFFNPHAVHVQANLMLRLAADIGERTPDTLFLFNKAISEVDRTVLILKNALIDPRDARNDLNMLGTIKARVLGVVGNLETLRKDAEQQWAQFQSQDGFALVGRVLFEQAEEKGAGRRYKAAFDYCQERMGLVQRASQNVSPALFEIAVQVYYRWQVQRNLFGSNSNEEIRWDLIRDYSDELLLTQERREDPFFRYLRALALAHMGDWAGANIAFTELRQTCQPRHLLHVHRDMLLHRRGGRRTVQGVIRRGHGAQFLHVGELQMDFQLDRASKWPREGEVAHAFIRFSFAGPKAVSAVSP